MKQTSVIVLAGVLMCFCVKDAFAALPPLAAGQSLEAQAERFHQEYSIEKRSREQKITKALIETEENEKEVDQPGVSFELKAVHVSGMTIFDPERLTFVWKPYVGKKVDFRDLNNIVRLIKRVYRDLGYLTTTAYLPPQDINSGVVEISVVEGKRGNLSVEGNRYFSTPSIAKYFHTYRGEVMDMGEIEKDVSRLNQNKDLGVTTVLSTGENPQEVDMILKAQDYLPYHVSIGTDNQGSNLTGRFRRLVNISTSNLTGNEDNLTFNGAYSDLSQGNYLSYQTPVGTYGTKLGLDAGYFQGLLGQQYKSLDVTNYTEFFDPNASFELYQSEDTQVHLRSGMQIKHINKKIAFAQVTNEDLRLPYLALDIIRMDPLGQTSFSPEISTSMPGFLGGSRGDNSRSSRPGVDKFFTKYDQYISRNQVMPWGSYMQIRSQIQFASRTLPTSEQLQLGGESSVRGYPEGDFLADSGGDMEAEWYFPMYGMPASWQLFGTRLKNDIEPFIFYDMGGGRLIKVNSGETRTRFLSGTGAGVKIHLKKNMYLKLEWAVATGDDPIHGTGPSTFDVSFQAGI